MRKLATVRRIDAIGPIEGADAIEVATIGGWKVVIKRGEFAIGDLAVYLEIDSWVPTELAPFLSKGKDPREYNGVRGERLRTVKLRGQISQGLLLPVDRLEDGTRFISGHFLEDGIGTLVTVQEGDDVTDILGIQKWEPIIPAQLTGDVKGLFPSEISKTDQERVQNLKGVIEAATDAGLLFELTEKLEGSSMTCYLIRGEFGVCSRNMDLKRSETNAFWATAIAEDIEAKMRTVDENWDFAIQGELIGPGIQGNIYGLSKPEFHVFDVYNIQAGMYLYPGERRELIARIGLKHVPVICPDKDLGVGSIDDILDWANDKSRLNPKQDREGIVFKQVDGGLTFKAISNRYLCKQG